jgi:hypothetical protein
MNSRLTPIDARIARLSRDGSRMAVGIGKALHPICPEEGSGAP